MKVRSLTIRSFRGIKELEWRLSDAPLFCLIGRGDSTKSTILEAIRIALYPHWNLVFDHSDFYLCTAEEFSIEVTIGQLPDELLEEDAIHESHEKTPIVFVWVRVVSWSLSGFRTREIQDCKQAYSPAVGASGITSLPGIPM